MRRTLVALTTTVIATVGLVSTASAHAATGQPSRVSTAVSPPAVAAAAPLAAESTDSAVIATQVVWTRRSTRVVYGSYAVLEGQVQRAEGAIPNLQVKLYAKPVGSDNWSYLTADHTDAGTGLFRFDRKPFRNTNYKAVFSGDATYAGSDAIARIDVRRKLSSAMVKNSDGSFKFYGSVAPAYHGKKVGLQRKKCSTCSWSTIGSTTSSGESMWRFRLTGPTSRTTWYYRAYTPNDSYFLAGYSDAWKITRY